MAKVKKLPKRIGGVKLPRAVRKGGLAEVLSSKAGQALIAEAVLAMGALAAKTIKESPKAHHKRAELTGKLRDAGDQAVGQATAAGAALTFALGEAVRSFSDALRHGEHRLAEPPVGDPKAQRAPRPPLEGRPPKSRPASLKASNSGAGPQSGLPS